MPLQPRIQRVPGCVADQAPASHAEVGNKSSCTVLPYTPSHHAQLYHYFLANCSSESLTVSNVGAMAPEVGATLRTGASGVLFAV